jgi:hypothetical protein
MKKPVSDLEPVLMNEGPYYENKNYEEKCLLFLNAPDPAIKLLRFKNHP